MKNKQIYTLVLMAIFSLFVNQQIFANVFDEDFTEETLNPLWSIVGDGHNGINNGFYSFTDNADNNGTELFRNIQGLPSGSFETTLTAVFKKFCSPNTKTAFSWIMNGHNGNISLIYNSFGKLELRHNDFDGKNGQLAVIDNIGISDGTALSVSIKFVKESNTIDVSYTKNSGEKISIYNGRGTDGAAFDDCFSLRSTAKLFKFDDTPDKSLVLIDSWNVRDL